MEVIRRSEYIYEIPKHGGMRVPGLIFGSEALFEQEGATEAFQQVVNVAHLPGILKYSIAMPDIHWGYGFPIGGVAAFDMDEGVVSPGGVGYDINCGVRLLRTNIEESDLKDRLPELVAALFSNIPTGVGAKRRDFKLNQKELERVCIKGAAWAVSKGFGDARDLKFIEEEGRIAGADLGKVSDRAIKRGLGQLGTLGSGNHFVEVGVVEEVYLERAATRFGLFRGGITVMIHTGSRGFGHQVCSDYVRILERASHKYGIQLPDRQLASAPINSPEGQDYLKAMACAANFAFANRQMITHWVRESFSAILKASSGELGMDVVYDVAHNIAKIETHEVEGKKKKVCVHRKGATRALPAGHPMLPRAYQDVGQPVLIPGDMGRYSYVLVGSPKALELTWASSCHGAGRVMSRNQAKKYAKGRDVFEEMEKRGIVVMAPGRATVVEEMPWAYKDVSLVVEAVEGAGIARKVAKIRPLGVIKG